MPTKNWDGQNAYHNKSLDKMPTFGWHFVRTPNCLTCCVVTPFVVAVICVVIITIVVVDILCCCHEIKKSLDVKLPHSFACLLDGTPQ